MFERVYLSLHVIRQLGICDQMQFAILMVQFYNCARKYAKKYAVYLCRVVLVGQLGGHSHLDPVQIKINDT